MGQPGDSGDFSEEEEYCGANPELTEAGQQGEELQVSQDLQPAAGAESPPLSRSDPAEKTQLVTGNILVSYIELALS